MRQAIGILCLVLAGALWASDHVTLPDWVPRPDVVVPGPPVPGDGKHVLIVEETAERRGLSAAQLAVLTSVEVRQYLKNNGIDHRVWDADTDASRDDRWFQEALRLPRTSLPWIVVSNGKAGVSAPLPANVDETIKLLEAYR